MSESLVHLKSALLHERNQVVSFLKEQYGEEMEDPVCAEIFPEAVAYIKNKFGPHIFLPDLIIVPDRERERLSHFLDKYIHSYGRIELDPNIHGQHIASLNLSIVFLNDGDNQNIIHKWEILANTIIHELLHGMRRYPFSYIYDAKRNHDPRNGYLPQIITRKPSTDNLESFIIQGITGYWPAVTENYKQYYYSLVLVEGYIQMITHQFAEELTNKTTKLSDLEKKHLLEKRKFRFPDLPFTMRSSRVTNVVDDYRKLTSNLIEKLIKVNPIIDKYLMELMTIDSGSGYNSPRFLELSQGLRKEITKILGYDGIREWLRSFTNKPDLCSKTGLIDAFFNLYNFARNKVSADKISYYCMPTLEEMIEALLSDTPSKEPSTPEPTHEQPFDITPIYTELWSKLKEIQYCVDTRTFVDTDLPRLVEGLLSLHSSDEDSEFTAKIPLSYSFDYLLKLERENGISSASIRCENIKDRFPEHFIQEISKAKGVSVICADELTSEYLFPFEGVNYRIEIIDNFKLKVKAEQNTVTAYQIVRFISHLISLSGNILNITDILSMSLNRDQKEKIRHICEFLKDPIVQHFLLVNHLETAKINKCDLDKYIETSKHRSKSLFRGLLHIVGDSSIKALYLPFILDQVKAILHSLGNQPMVTMKAKGLTAIIEILPNELMQGERARYHDLSLPDGFLIHQVILRLNETIPQSSFNTGEVILERA